MIYIVGRLFSGRKLAKEIIKNHFPQVDCKIIDYGDIYDLAEMENYKEKVIIIHIDSYFLDRYIRFYKDKNTTGSTRTFKGIDEQMDELMNIFCPVSDFVVKNNDTLDNFKINLLTIVKKIVDKNKGVKQ